MFRQPLTHARSPQKYSMVWWDRWIKKTTAQRIWLPLKLTYSCAGDQGPPFQPSFSWMPDWSRCTTLLKSHYTLPIKHCQWWCVKIHSVLINMILKCKCDNLCHILWWKPNPVMMVTKVMMMMIHFQSCCQQHHVDQWSARWTWWDSCLWHWVDVWRPQQWDQQGGNLVEKLLHFLRFSILRNICWESKLGGTLTGREQLVRSMQSSTMWLLLASLQAGRPIGYLILIASYHILSYDTISYPIRLPCRESWWKTLW